MGDDISDSDGLGPARSGPDFHVGSGESGQPPPGQLFGSTPPARQRPRTRPSRRPAAITIAVIAVVAAIAVIGTIAAQRADVRAVQAERSAQAQQPPTPYQTPPADQIDFATRGGTGILRIVDHAWLSVRGEPPNAGDALQIEVEIVCVTGEVGYDPFNFQAFDSRGSVYDMTAEEVRGEVIGVGTLQPGESVRGLVAFVIPRGEVTLLMSDDATSVTALRVPN